VGDFTGHPFRGNQYTAGHAAMSWGNLTSDYRLPGESDKDFRGREAAKQELYAEAHRQVVGSGKAVYSVATEVGDRAREIHEGGLDAPGKHASTVASSRTMGGWQTTVTRAGGSRVEYGKTKPITRGASTKLWAREYDAQGQLVRERNFSTAGPGQHYERFRAHVEKLGVPYREPESK